MREKTQIDQENKNQIGILNKPTFEQQTLQLKQHCSSYSPSLQLNSQHPKFSKPKEYKPKKLTLNIGHNKISGTKTTTLNISEPTSPNPHFFNCQDHIETHNPTTTVLKSLPIWLILNPHAATSHAVTTTNLNISL